MTSIPKPCARCNKETTDMYRLSIRVYCHDCMPIMLAKVEALLRKEDYKK